MGLRKTETNMDFAKNRAKNASLNIWNSIEHYRKFEH